MASPNPEPLKLEALTPAGGVGGGEGQQPFGAGAAAAGEQQTPWKALAVRKDRACTAKERISRMPPCAAGKRSSIYRGVTRYAPPRPVITVLPTENLDRSVRASSGSMVRSVPGIQSVRLRLATLFPPFGICELSATSEKKLCL
jgi:hypothetical protein